MSLKDHAFKTTFKPYRKLVILGQTISNKRIKSITPIHAELDYPHLTTFNIGNVTITLFDPEGTFNPNNTDNFWTHHQNNNNIPQHYKQTGYKGPIQIHIGYDNNGTIATEKTFDGEIANIRVNLQPPEIIIEAVDASQNLRPTKLHNFGISRSVILSEIEDNTYVGRYPFPGYSIASQNSVKAITTISKDEMIDVGTISTEGITSPLNYQINGNAIETEGGPLYYPNKIQAQFKDVYRYKRIDTLIKNILHHYNIKDYEIEILKQRTDEPIFASNGRPGWELENLSTGPFTRQWNWDGYVKDVVYDAKNKIFYMLYGQRANNLPDYLIAYDVRTDHYERIATTDNNAYEYEMWQLATDDFNTFFILATIYTENHLNVQDLGVYNPFEPNSKIHILKYERNTNTWTVINDSTDNVPQIGVHYAENEPPPPLGLYQTRTSILPDNRTVFDVKTINGKRELIYRSVNGINTYNITDDTVTEIKRLTTNQVSCDAFIGTTSQTTFFAWIEADETSSTLRIDDGNGAEIINATYQNNDNPFWYAPGTAKIITVTDMLYHDGNLYAMLQISSGSTAEGALIKVEVARGVLKLIKHYDSFVKAARSPVLHQNTIYYFEGSHHQYGKVKDRETYPDDTGHLIRIDGDTATDLGLCWRSSVDTVIDPDTNTADIGFGRHGGTASPMISDGQAIHFWTGYGDITDPNTSPARHIDNWQWLQYSNFIPQRIPIFHTNDQRAWQLLNDIARLTNGTISFKKGKFSFSPRTTRHTTLETDITPTSNRFIVKDASRFDKTGMVLINDELIDYQTLTNNEITDARRGIEGSQTTSHKKGDRVLFVDALVFNHPDKQNLGSLKFKPDFLGIKNKLTAKLTPIGTEKAEVYVESEESIIANGEKPHDLDMTMLTWHERPWAEVLLNEYLTEMQQAQYEVDIELPWSPHLLLGQTLVVDQQVVAHLRWTPVRILRIAHDFNTRTTRLTARTFGNYRTSEHTTLTFNSKIKTHHTFIVNEPIQPIELPIATGGVGNLTYKITNLPPGLAYDDTTTHQITGTPTQIGTTVIEYSVTDTSTVPQTASLHKRITIVTPLTFTESIPEQIVYDENRYINHKLPEATGGIGQLHYELIGYPNQLKFDVSDRRVRGVVPAGGWDIEYRVTDSADTPNTISQHTDLFGDSEPYWSGLIMTETHISKLDRTSGILRVYDVESDRVQTMDLRLGAGEWTGCAKTVDRRIFVNNTDKTAIFYDLTATGTDAPLVSETINLGAGEWRGVTAIGANRIGFLDRKNKLISIYNETRTLIPSEQIRLGFTAQFSDIASNADGTKIYVLIENLAAIFVWSIPDAAFNYAETIPLRRGTTDWQAITLNPNGSISTIHHNSIQIK